MVLGCLCHAQSQIVFSAAPHLRRRFAALKHRRTRSRKTQFTHPMKDDSKSSLKSFFQSSSNASVNSDSDDRSYRFFLKKRDTHDSSSSSLENLSSVGSKTSTDSKKGSHVSLRRFLKKFKHEDKEKKKKRHHHFLPSHPQSDLYRKYTKGRLLGTGASGSVNLVHLKTDSSKVYAVKKFRLKLPNEPELDYKVKVNNEFRIGEVLEHENLIKTVELIQDHATVFGHPEYYIIMEYCPYDFFNLVMSGLMSEREINCYFAQIIGGVGYLHSQGLAHRDLKLDNCVVSDRGILKLIDFGSAVQYRKPIIPGIIPDEVLVVDDKEFRLVLSKGIVGSDPYLSPEVFEVAEDENGVPSKGYDARRADVWSIAIIYCCMVLKRFPWKLPKTSDSSYKQFLHNQDKLFKMLPENSVPVIARMLKPASERALLDEVVDHEFFESIDKCLTSHVAGDHEHHLVTEEDLEQIKKEKEMVKKLKDTGIA